MTTEDIREAMDTLVHDIIEHPESAVATFSVHGHRKGWTLCEARTKDYKFLIDAPEEMAGSNKGPNPVELVLAALGACHEILYSLYAAKMNIPLYSVEVNTEGKLDLRGIFETDLKVPSNFIEINMDTRLISPASEEELKPLIEKVKEHSPVMNVLRKPVAVHSRVDCLKPEMMED